MNSRDYEVIKNIQDASFGGRKYFADLLTPDFKKHANSVGWYYHKLTDLSLAKTTLTDVVNAKGTNLVEVDMRAIGSYAQAFGGPPVRKSK